MPGPAPKRSSQRRRYNKPSTPEQHGHAGEVVIPPPRDEWHWVACSYYDAFLHSGQSAFFEQSDWSLVLDVCDDITEYKNSATRPATKRMAIDSMLSRLLVAEGDRRRARIELDKSGGSDQDDDASVSELHRHVRRFTG